MAITADEIRAFADRVYISLLAARTTNELYGKLNELRSGEPAWQLLRSPMWYGDVLVAVIVMPDPEVT